MKLELIALLLLATLAACSNETNDSSEKETPQKTVVEDQTKPAPEVEEEPTIDSSWNYYSAYIGTYQEPVMIELSFNGDNVNGSYWYAKHGKELKLTGELNSETQKYEVSESYKGKTTGKMMFSLDKDMSLIAEWSNPKGEDKESFNGVLLDLPDTKKKKPTFSEYQLDHKIEVFDSEIDDFKIEEVNDGCKVMRVGKTVVFTYGVVGHNYHTGSIDGTFMVDANEKGTFKGDNDCTMSFTFKGNELIIEEETDCSYYRGARAYFGGTLTKK
jgi:hypothetical protein